MKISNTNEIKYEFFFCAVTRCTYEKDRKMRIISRAYIYRHEHKQKYKYM